MATRSKSTTLNAINLSGLGFFLDGWADVVEGMGKKANQVRKDVLTHLETRGMPDIEFGSRTGYTAVTTGEHRDYVSTETYPGAITMIYIAEHGKDLYASWRTYIRPIINAAVLFVLGVASLFFALIIAANPNNRLGIGGFFGGLLVTYIILALLLAFAGYVVRGDPLAFFLVQPNYFDTDDITAMSLSVHYSVLRALDKAGIDSSKLRLKRDFKTGRKGNTI